jgi:bifunctional non-homologous end joining protein LigD
VTDRLDIAGRSIRFTNEDKVLWPETGTTKGDLLRYYLAVAPVLLPHLEERPLTLGRWPDGVDAQGWFQTTCPAPPEWIPTHPVPGRPGTRRPPNYCIVNEIAALAWMVNLAAIELHPLLGRRPAVDRPTALVFDLDPAPDAAPATAAAVAVLVRDVLDRDGLRAVPKTSGGFGLHVVVPLAPVHGYAEAKSYVRDVARELAQRHPELVVDRQDRSLRAGRVLIDWNQNDERKSTAAVYSVRALGFPSVSTPLRWEELEAAARGETPLLFDTATVLRRLERLGDLSRPMLESDQRLPGRSPASD